ncbi:MAG: YdcF family protein [Silicimonas sp.]|nr:YdcF family protein [Silicimonas sp.]
MALIRWIFAIAILSIWTALIGTALYVALYQADPEAPSGDAIVVLAGNAGKNSAGLSGETQARFDAALALYEAGAAPLLVMTGGGEPPVAEFMRDAALEAGVPAEAILVENQSRSTLQNALFTADIESLDKTAPIIIVTHRYHLLRAKASFRWAGFSDVTNYAADPDGGFQISQGLLWESLKWPLNVLRAAAASAAAAGDVPRENYLKYLE